MTSEILKPHFLAQGKFYQYKASTDQKFLIERVIIDLDWGSRYPVNSFINVIRYNDNLWIKIFFGPQGTEMDV